MRGRLLDTQKSGFIYILKRRTFLNVYKEENGDLDFPMLKLPFFCGGARVCVVVGIVDVDALCALAYDVVPACFDTQC